MAHPRGRKHSTSEGRCIEHPGATSRPVEFDADTGRIDVDELDQLRAKCTPDTLRDMGLGVDGDQDFEEPTSQIPRLPAMDGMMDGLVTLPKRSATLSGPGVDNSGDASREPRVWKSAVKPISAAEATHDSIEYFDPDELFSEWEQEYSSQPSVPFEIVVSEPVTKERLAELEGDRGISISETPDDFFD
jgi:hypothetical protein